MNKEITAFYPCYNAQPDEYTKLNYELLTTIVYTQVKINANDSISQSSGYNPGPMISYVHIRGIKMVLMFQAKDAASADAILANQGGERAVAISNLLSEVQMYHFDGIDIDLEGINGNNSINGQPNKQLMTDFITELSNIFWTSNPNYRISMDIGIWYLGVDNIFDLTILQNKVNYVTIMGYDYYGSWSANAGPNGPISLDNGKGIYDSLKHYEGLMDKKKLLLAVPWYGYEFPTVSGTRLAAKNGNAIQITYENYIKVVNNYTVNWDSVWQTPWYVRQDGVQWYQGHYDDIRSLGIKYDLVKSEGLSGVGIWAVTQGTNRPELWQLIQDKFTCPNLGLNITI